MLTRVNKILFIKSSPRGDASLSSLVGEELVSELVARYANTTVTVRDLVNAPLPHITPAFVAASFTADEDRNETQRESLAASDGAIQELVDANIIVIASAMINFGISSTLKAWVDNVVRSGKTFRQTENGTEGLLNGKKVYLVLARGGIYTNGPRSAYDFQEAYLRAILGFMGMTDIESIHIEGVARPEVVDSAVGAAISKAKVFAQAAC